MAELLGILQIALYVLGMGGVVYWLRHQIIALKGAVDAQEATIKAQAESLGAQREVLQRFERLAETMRVVLESTDEPKMLGRLKAYKEFVDHEKATVFQEIAQAKQSLERLVKSAGEAIISVDPQDRVRSWNPAAERIWGLTEHEILGSPIWEILPAQDYRRFKAALSKDHPVQTYEAMVPRRDGVNLYLAVTMSTFGTADDSPEAILAIVVRDTTAQREMDTRLRQTEKLTALGQMAGGIAHDFNNLLSAVLGYAQVMERNPDNADMIRRGIKVIQTAAVGGMETVRRIMMFARLRSDEAFISVDVNQAIRDAVAICAPRVEEQVRRGVSLQLDLDLNVVPLILGRPAAIAEVVVNLILNAIDAMPSGGSLRVRTADQDNRWVVVTVSDTGTGMSPAVLDKVLEPFFTTKGDKGSGLGLAVSYATIRRHGGEISVESREGAGTAVIVRLPVTGYGGGDEEKGTEPISPTGPPVS